VAVNNRISSRGPGRPKICQQPDLRLTIRFRYHCDQDLIQVLQETPNKNALVRSALRRWIMQEQDNLNNRTAACRTTTSGSGRGEMRHLIVAQLAMEARDR